MALLGIKKKKNEKKRKRHTERQFEAINYRFAKQSLLLPIHDRVKHVAVESFRGVRRRGGGRGSRGSFKFI